MIIEVNPEERVICDFCNKEFYDDDTKGGLAFNSSAVCPDCAPHIRKNAKENDETKYIVENDGRTFYEFVMLMRGKVKITRKSILDKKERSMYLQINLDQIDAYSHGIPIQHAFPQLSPGEREFIHSGITPGQWDEVMGEEEEG